MKADATKRFIRRVAQEGLSAVRCREFRIIVETLDPDALTVELKIEMYDADKALMATLRTGEYLREGDCLSFLVNEAFKFSFVSQ